MKKYILLSILVFSGFSFLNAQESDSKSSVPGPPEHLSYNNGFYVEPNPDSEIDGWEMNENWNHWDAGSSMSNDAGVPVLIGTYPGEVIKFPFDGDAVGIAVVAGPDAGIIEFSIDNSEWEKLDLYTNEDEELYQTKHHELASGLRNRSHMLQIRMAEENNPESLGKTCRLRYFFFNSPE